MPSADERPTRPQPASRARAAAAGRPEPAAARPDDDPAIRTLASHEVYRNAWMVVREDRVVRKDGSESIYGVVDKPDFALVIPMEGRWPDARFHLVQQYRYPVGRRVWEFPQGAWQGRQDVEPSDLARRELAEETGLRAGTLVHLGHLDAANGYSSQGCDVWLAHDLRPGPHRREPEEQDMVQAVVSRPSLEAMVGTPDFADAHSLAAYALLLLRMSGRAPGNELAGEAPPSSRPAGH